MNQFFEERINVGQGFLKPLKRNNLKTFETLNKTETQAVSAKINDKDYFSRNIIIGQMRKMDLKELFSYELTRIPLSIATSDGCLRKTNKSTLLHALEKESVPSESLTQNMLECAVFDMMALVQAQPNTAKTFGEYAQQLFRTILARSKGVQRIDRYCMRPISTRHVNQAA